MYTQSTTTLTSTLTSTIATTTTTVWIATSITSSVDLSTASLQPSITFLTTAETVDPATTANLDDLGGFIGKDHDGGDKYLGGTDSLKSRSWTMGLVAMGYFLVLLYENTRSQVY